MSARFSVSFARSARIDGGLAVLLQREGEGDAAGAALADPEGIIARAAGIAKFTAKPGKLLDIVAPHGSSADRLAVLGIGKAEALTRLDWLKAGGNAAAAVKSATRVTVFLDVPGLEVTPRAAADFALGLILRGYGFDTYKTKAGDDEEKPGEAVAVTIVTGAAAAAKKAFAEAEAGAGGVVLARDLVNLPPNVLGPVEFAERARELEALGVEVEILTEAELQALGFGALLGVARGSVRPPRLAVLQWKGGKAKQAPLAFVGKGVVFDSGGISIKPGAGMEEMKGDMAGAAAVTGLFRTLAARKARVNAVGILGLVENMPDGNAQRPGDIVTSLSGQTIEIINTDAEGRLVLADALWYVIDRFKPRLVIDLATLTGAVVVALGNLHAGLFSNDDELAAALAAAGEATGERLWRLPLGRDYDKLIDSKFADMKNTGGRQAGSITAAQFLKRFVGETPWAHLDIAGTGLNSPASEISQSWASGFGVRLLDEFVRENHETR